MKPLDKLPVAMRLCERCGKLVPVRYGVQEEHTAEGRICKPKGSGRSQTQKRKPGD